MPVYVATYFVRKQLAFNADSAKEVAAVLRPAIEKDNGLLLSIIPHEEPPPPPPPPGPIGEAA